ncbi:MAG TPA: DUF5985 family protein [Noviherbaspirillum sp.]|jgi:hypothetical protein|uniref:DUF5985 family protein n=1 Tax=Noviherbaspirillum sp. TaxID=1926288 RepID=UPI002F94C582
MNDILVGAIATASFIVALFFFRFWSSTRDRLFLCFSLAFFIEGANRLLLGNPVHGDAGGEDHVVYLLRLASYALILVGIWLKNRAPARKGE